MQQNGELYLSNLLLASISQSNFLRMGDHFEEVDLDLHQVLHSAGAAIEHLYFPTSGICSVIVRAGDGLLLEAGIIGKEGVVGLSLALFVDESPFEVIVQLPGRALRISRDAFLEMQNSNLHFRNTILRYIYIFMIQTAQTALANGKLTIQERLARWLLMCHDRADAREFIMTHKFLSTMLAVRRAGVTTALQHLESKSAIKSTRGKVKIINRAVLEQLANSAYGKPEAEHRRLIGAGIF